MLLAAGQHKACRSDRRLFNAAARAFEPFDFCQRLANGEGETIKFGRAGQIALDVEQSIANGCQVDMDGLTVAMKDVEHGKNP